MHFTSTAIIFIIIITICSIFLANLIDLLSTDKSIAQKLQQTYKTAEKRELQINTSEDHLIWFIQISDLHISLFEDPTRITQLKEFVHQTVDAINPAVVLASGDLTDAKAKDNIFSHQIEKEWQIYHDILHEARIPEKTVWLDVRGNHDNFNVASINSSDNYFRKYSMQGTRHPRSYMYQKQVGSEKYTFIAVDACLEPGPKRSHNFLGLLKKEDTSQIIDYAEQSRLSGGNYTVWFGHYPTSCILSPGTGPRGIRSVLGQFIEGYVYLCGHLHTLRGMIPKNMHTLQKEGFLELELGDWKYNRMFRVAAIDHSLFSFVDVDYNEWPIILITNPKHPLYRIPTRENPKLQIESTHIRILAFSLSEIIGCTVKIDDELAGACEKINNNLFVQKWSPKNYTKHHKIYVTITDADGRSKAIEQPFTNGETELEFGLLARFVLMTEVIALFRLAFWLAIFLCVIPMSVLRVWYWLVLNEKVSLPHLRYNFINLWIHKLWILASIDRIYFPIVCYCMYLTFGPWSFGSIVNDSSSITFVWGIYINGSWIPSNMTYFHGFFQLMLCHFPMIFLCASKISNRFNSDAKMWDTLLLNAGFLVVFILHIRYVYEFYMEYGFWTLIIDPLKTGSLLLNVYLWYQARTLPERLLHSTNNLWLEKANLVHQS